MCFHENAGNMKKIKFDSGAYPPSFRIFFYGFVLFLVYIFGLFRSFMLALSLLCAVWCVQRA